MLVTRFIYLSLFLVLAACNTMQVKDFADSNPKFELFEFFSGKLKGEGLFYDRFKNVKSRFKLELEGKMLTNDKLELKETLTYINNNEVTKRIFVITKQADNYLLECSDLVSNGIISESGNALQWNYTLKQPIDGKTYNLKFDDWMFRMSENSVLNRAYAYWYGIYVGEVIMHVAKI